MLAAACSALGRRPHELNPLGHALGTWLLAAGDRQSFLAIDLRANRHALATAAGMNLGLDDNQPSTECVIGPSRLGR